MELTVPARGEAFGLAESLMVYMPVLLCLLAVALIVLAVLPKLPRPMRIFFGIAGGALLLWALWYFIFRSIT